MKEIMMDNLMIIYILDKYVDDINVVNECIDKGSTWNGDRIEWSEEWESEDLVSGKLDEIITMEAMLGIGKGIIPCLEFTSDLPEDKLDGNVLCWTIKHRWRGYRIQVIPEEYSAT